MPQNSKISSFQIISNICQCINKNQIDTFFKIINEYKNAFDINAHVPSALFPNLSPRNNLLHVACQQGRAEIVKILLACGIDYRAMNGAGFNALHKASLEGHVEIVQTLLEHDQMQVQLQIERRRTQEIGDGRNTLNINSSLEGKHSNINQNASFRIKDKFITWDGSQKVTNVDLRHKKQYTNPQNRQSVHSPSSFVSTSFDFVNSKTNTARRTTALMQATGYGHAEVVKTLLEFGADPLMRDDDGLSSVERISESSMRFVYDAHWSILQYSMKRISLISSLLGDLITDTMSDYESNINVPPSQHPDTEFIQDLQQDLLHHQRNLRLASEIERMSLRIVSFWKDNKKYFPKWFHYLTEKVRFDIFTTCRDNQLFFDLESEHWASEEYFQAFVPEIQEISNLSKDPDAFPILIESFFTTTDIRHAEFIHNEPNMYFDDRLLSKESIAMDILCRKFSIAMYLIQFIRHYESIDKKYLLDEEVDNVEDVKSLAINNSAKSQNNNNRSEHAVNLRPNNIEIQVNNFVSKVENNQEMNNIPEQMNHDDHKNLINHSPSKSNSRIFRDDTSRSVSKHSSNSFASDSDLDEEEFEKQKNPMRISNSWSHLPDGDSNSTTINSEGKVSTLTQEIDTTTPEKQILPFIATPYTAKIEAPLAETRHDGSSPPIEEAMEHPIIYNIPSNSIRKQDTEHENDNSIISIDDTAVEYSVAHNKLMEEDSSSISPTKLDAIPKVETEQDDTVIVVKGDVMVTRNYNIPQNPETETYEDESNSEEVLEDSADGEADNSISSPSLLADDSKQPREANPLESTETLGVLPPQHSQSFSINTPTSSICRKQHVDDMLKTPNSSTQFSFSLQLEGGLEASTDSGFVLGKTPLPKDHSSLIKTDAQIVTPPPLVLTFSPKLSSILNTPRRKSPSNVKNQVEDIYTSTFEESTDLSQNEKNTEGHEQMSFGRKYNVKADTLPRLSSKQYKSACETFNIEHQELHEPTYVDDSNISQAEDKQNSPVGEYNVIVDDEGESASSISDSQNHESLRFKSDYGLISSDAEIALQNSKPLISNLDLSFEEKKKLAKCIRIYGYEEAFDRYDTFNDTCIRYKFKSSSAEHIPLEHPYGRILSQFLSKLEFGQ